MTDPDQRPMRIGGVPYGVGAPLLAGIPRDEGGAAVLVTAPPAELIERLRSGELDAALASSIEAFRRPGYRVVDGIGICCDGPVRSVRAFVAPGVTRVRTIGVDRATETSIALLRILLARGWVPELGAADPSYERVAATNAPDRLPHDVVLMIGDCGLRADPGDRRVLDLGELWHAATGSPFVFASWLIGPNARVAELVPVLRAARERGRGMEGQDGTDGAVYYDVGPRELAGLERFRAEAVALGLAVADCRPAMLR